MMSEHILTAIQDGIMTIQMNHPERKNALTFAMYEGITAALRLAEADDDVRVVLLTGVMDCFSSGNDLIDFLKVPAADESSPAVQFLRTISRAAKPIVAAVNGPAIGIGMTMLLHCDLVYAGEKARFQMPFINLGLVPEGGSSYIIPLMMGHARGAELLMLGTSIDAAKALSLGIVTAVYPVEEFLAAAQNAAARLASLPPAALRKTKMLLKRASTSQIQETITTELVDFFNQLQSPEAKEAFQAFLEKRKPDFSKFR
jgi:enoyl-CoA hydratase/carnithine racemase